MKAALLKATEAIALDLAPYGIRINCVAPGAIQVRHSESVNHHYKALGEKIPLGRAGTPEDIGDAVAWLVSERASYVTGITVKVDGGLILPGMPEHMSSMSEHGWGFIKK